MVVGDPTAYEPERPPSFTPAALASLDDWRGRVLPLPDEVIDQYLGHGERMIHSDHPSFQAFAVQNTILFLVLFVFATVFLGVSFNGSFVSAGLVFLVLGIVLLYLVLKRLRERYTSYVVTNVRIMVISGVFSRRAHSIPWVRVTDLTYEQNLVGRLFGYATLHIESANEEGGLRDLEGISDPLRFNQYVIDMVVAKQGPTAPLWEAQGEPAPVVAREASERRVPHHRRLRARPPPAGPPWPRPRRRALAPEGPARRHPRAPGHAGAPRVDRPAAESTPPPAVRPRRSPSAFAEATQSTPSGGRSNPSPPPGGDDDKSCPRVK